MDENSKIISLLRIIISILLIGIYFWFMYEVVNSHFEYTTSKSTIEKFFNELNQKDIKGATYYLDSKAKKRDLLRVYEETIKKYDVRYDIKDIDILKLKSGSIKAKVYYRKYIYKKGKRDSAIVYDNVARIYLRERKTNTYEYLIEDIMPIVKKRMFIDFREF